MGDERLGPDPGLGYGAVRTELAVCRLDGARTSDRREEVAEEVPVAFVYGGRSHAVMMATPDDLEDLAVGFTVTEGIAVAGDIGAVTVARHSRGIELSVQVPAAALDAMSARARTVTGRTGCGLCGIGSIDDAVRAPRVVGATLRVPADALYRAGAALTAHQPLNAHTHAVHAAAWATPDGVLRCVREDVGRHNALDKVLGALWRRGDDPSRGFLLLTSRASYELVQKANLAGVELVAAVSRPTGLAVRLAASAGMTLAALLRGEGVQLYSAGGRVTVAPGEPASGP